MSFFLQQFNTNSGSQLIMSNIGLFRNTNRLSDCCVIDKKQQSKSKSIFFQAVLDQELPVAADNRQPILC